MQPRSRPLYDRDGSEALERAAPSLDREIAKAKGVILDRRRAGPIDPPGHWPHAKAILGGRSENLSSHSAI